MEWGFFPQGVVFNGKEKMERCAQDDQDAVTKGAIKFETGHKQSYSI